MGRVLPLVLASAVAWSGRAVAMSDVIAGVDVLARCEARLRDLPSSATPAPATFLTLPASDVPPDVAAALSAYSLTWGSLSDIMRIGVLWAHGYVVAGGSAGSAPSLVKIYTACDLDAAPRETVAGWYMDTIALPAAQFAGVQCENNTCGTFSQATNDKCSDALAAHLLCAVDATSLPASDESFWSDAGNDSSNAPFPQVYTHTIPLSATSATANGSASARTNTTSSGRRAAATKTATIISIHMATVSSGSPRCGNTGDAIVPCLALADVHSAQPFCRPKIDDGRLKSFFAAVTKVLGDASAAAASAKTGDASGGGGGLSAGAIVGIIGGAVVVLGLLAFYFFRSKKKARRDDPDYPGFGRKSSNGHSHGHGHGAAAGAGAGQGFGVGRGGGKQIERGASYIPIMGSPGAKDTWSPTNYVRRDSGPDGPSSHQPPQRPPFLQRPVEPTETEPMPTGGSSRGAMYGKSVEEYCEESEIICAFVTDPQIKIRRIPYDELTVLRILSKGSYGEVYLGQLETRHVAMKRLLPEKKHLTKSIEQFMGEIQIMCNLEHRNIVTFVGVSWDYLQNISVVVEYMDNGDLAEVLAKSKLKFSWPKEKISIAMDVAEGLVYLHSMRPVIVHRDLKSKNVLLNKRGQAKLSDFGVSRKTAVNETMTSGVGTLLWTAPEIIEGRKYSEKADIFSLGVVLSEIDTCEEPYSTVKNEDTGDRLPGMQIVQMVRSGKLRVHFRDDCPPKLRELAQQCTSLDPDMRPTSMEVAYTLKSIIAPSLRAAAAAGSASSK